VTKQHFSGERESSRSYSRAIKVQGGTTIYLAGVGGTPDSQGRSLAGDFTAQTHRAFERLRENVELAGGTLDDIVTMTVFITDSRYGDEFVELRKHYFTKGYPCSALIGVHSLANPAMLVEIQAIAVVDN
jgi:2-iminobutanoate/2-iminopropanoate deaminase